MVQNDGHGAFAKIACTPAAKASAARRSDLRQNLLGLGLGHDDRACLPNRAVHVGACSAGRSLNFDVKESGVLRAAKTDRRLRSEEQCKDEKNCANAGGCTAMAKRPVQRLSIERSYAARRGAK